VQLDVYAFGMTLKELFTGCRPLSQGAMQTELKKLERTQGLLVDLMRKCCARSPDDR
jgi:hypothetical protein